MHTSCSLIVLGAYALLANAIAPAAAEDFTGFYGGVNAGGAFDGTTKRAGAAPNGASPPASGPPVDGTTLPPSAAGAAAGLRERAASGPHRSPR